MNLGPIMKRIHLGQCYQEHCDELEEIGFEFENEEKLFVTLLKISKRLYKFTSPNIRICEYLSIV